MKSHSNRMTLIDQLIQDFLTKESGTSGPQLTRLHLAPLMPKPVLDILSRVQEPYLMRGNTEYNLLMSAIPFIRSNSANGRAAIVNSCVLNDNPNRMDIDGMMDERYLDSGKSIIKVALSGDADPLYQDAYVLYILTHFLYSQEPLMKHFMTVDTIFTAQLYRPRAGINVADAFVRNQQQFAGIVVPCIMSPAVSNPVDLHDTASACCAPGIQRRSTTAFFEKLEEFIHAVIGISSKTGFVHNDMHAGNVLWDSQQKCFTLIDFGRSYINDMGGKETFEFVKRAFAGTTIYKDALIENTSVDDMFQANYFTKRGSYAIYADVGGLILALMQEIPNFQDALYLYIQGKLPGTQRPIHIQEGNIHIDALIALHWLKSGSPALKSIGFIAFFIYTYFEVYGTASYARTKSIHIDDVFGQDSSRSLIFPSGIVFPDCYDKLIDPGKEIDKATMFDKSMRLMERMFTRQGKKQGGSSPLQMKRRRHVVDGDLNAIVPTVSAWERVYEHKERFAFPARPDNTRQMPSDLSYLEAKYDAMYNALETSLKCKERDVMNPESCLPKEISASGGKAAKDNKSCIMLKGQSKKRKVRLDKTTRKKYVVIKGEHVYLKDIKGRYNYV